jgi:hypothetical protein
VIAVGRRGDGAAVVGGVTAGHGGDFLEHAARRKWGGGQRAKKLNGRTVDVVWMWQYWRGEVFGDDLAKEWCIRKVSQVQNGRGTYNRRNGW